MTFNEAIAIFGRPIPLIFKIITDAGTHIMMNSPSGWNGNMFNWTRNRTTMAVIRSFSDEFTFVGVERDLIMSVPNSGNLNSDTFVEMWKLNSTTLEYELDYKGRVNYTDITDDGTECKVKLIDMGIFAFIERNSSIDYELKQFTDFLKYSDIGDWYISNAINQYAQWSQDIITTSAPSLQVFRPFLLLDNETQGLQNQVAGIKIDFFGYEVHWDNGWQPYYRTDLGFYTSANGVNQIQFNIKIQTLQSFAGNPCTLALQSEDLYTYVTIQDFTVSPSGANVDVVKTIDFNSSGVQLWKLVLIFSARLINGQIFTIPSITGEISINKFRKTSDLEVVSLPYACEQILEQMTGSYQIVEGLEDLADKMIMNGNCLKGETIYFNSAGGGTEGMRFVPKLNWDDFTKHIRNVHGYTYVIKEDRVVFTKEPFSTDVWVDLGEVGKFKQTVMKDYLYKSVKAGFGQVDSVDRYIFDLQREKTFDLVDFKVVDANVLDLSSNINCSVYAINEKFRETYDAERDILEDNDLFMIDTEVVPILGRIPKYNQNSYIKIGAGNFFNLDYTAMRIMERHTAYLQLLNSNFELEYKNQNKAVDVSFVNEEFGRVTNEDQDVNADYPITLHPQRIETILYEIETSERNINFRELLENSNKIITFTYKNETFYGYFDDFGESSYNQETKTIRLIKAKI